MYTYLHKGLIMFLNSVSQGLTRINLYDLKQNSHLKLNPNFGETKK